MIFLHNDKTLAADWLTSIERTIQSWQPDALGGKIEELFVEAERPGGLQDELLGFLGKLDHGTARWLTESTIPIFGGNFAFRRNVFERIGNFDARLGRQGTANIGGEDTEIYQRLLAHGCHVRWVPDAIIQRRIQTPKLRRGYFLDLHFRQGRIEGNQERADKPRIPPAYLIPQLWRAMTGALVQRLREGAKAALRREMNVAYFVGYLVGWSLGQSKKA